MVATGALASPNDSYAAGKPIPNYVYGAFTSDQMGRYLQLDRTGLPAWFVGDDLPTTPHWPRTSRRVTPVGPTPEPSSTAVTGCWATTSRNGQTGTASVLARSVRRAVDRRRETPCCRSIPSAANPIAQVQHAVAADDHVRVFEQVLAVDRTEVAFA